MDDHALPPWDSRGDHAVHNGNICTHLNAHCSLPPPRFQRRKHVDYTVPYRNLSYDNDRLMQTLVI